MTETMRMQVVKGRSQTIAETVTSVFILGMTYYMLRPDKLTKHRNMVQSKIDAVKYWVSVQDTLASIRSLPETDF